MCKASEIIAQSMLLLPLVHNLMTLYVACAHGARERFIGHMEQERGSLSTWSKREVHCAHGARERFTEHMEQERGSLSTWSKREVH
jgi:hypothetical protein